ncbi:MAG: Holliday junction resolvase RuvX [Pseudohongiellaceae bacterium]
MEKFPLKKTREFSVMGFDFGTKRIGVAFGQTLTGTASALSPVTARDGIPDWQMLDKLIAEWQPDAFLVGLPYNMDDTESELLVRARKFGNRLNGRYAKPCYGMDERLSTFEARGQRMRGESDAQLDSLSAQLVLEAWFNEMNDRFGT